MRLKFALALIISLFSMGILAPAPDAYEVVEVKNGGAIAGKITFSGAPPQPASHLITKDHGVCGKGKIEVREIDVKAGALRGVVVYLEKVEKGKAFPKAASRAVVDQKKCVFEPYILVARNKSKLTIKNSDPVLHNIHAYELIGKLRRSMFNIAQPKSKPKARKKSADAGAGLCASSATPTIGCWASCTSPKTPTTPSWVATAPTPSAMSRRAATPSRRGIPPSGFRKNR